MKVTYYTVSVPVEKAVKIAVVADTHGSDFTEALRLTDKEKPDIIAVPGDLFNDRPNRTEYLKSFMQRASATAPVFYSVGNHDISITDEEKRIVAENGGVFLAESRVRFGGLLIGGLSTGFAAHGQGHFKKTPPPDTDFIERFASENGVKILLSHHPEYYRKYLRDSNIDLIISGHAHGGQIRIGRRGLFAPGQGFFPKYVHGVYENRLAVSAGLVNSAPYIPRLFNEREVMILNLVPGN